MYLLQYVNVSSFFAVHARGNSSDSGSGKDFIESYCLRTNFDALTLRNVAVSVLDPPKLYRF